VKKKLFYGCGIAVLVLGILYGAGTFYYRDKFLHGTTINGILCENLTVKNTEDKIKQKVEEYSLELVFKDNKKEKIQGQDIDYHYFSSGEIKKLMKKQNPWIWFSEFLGNKKEYKVSEKIQFSEEKLAERLQSMDTMKEENMTLPSDAYIAFENNQFVIKEETIGTALEKDMVLTKVKEAVEKKEETWSAEEAEVYKKPAITKEDAALKHQQEVLNSCAAVTVTYTFGEQTEVLNGMTVKDWMTYDEHGNYVENPEQLRRNIRAYVNALSEKYNTVGRSRTITSTATGQPVEIKGGSYGFLIDIKKESAQQIGRASCRERV